MSSSHDSFLPKLLLIQIPYAMLWNAAITRSQRPKDGYTAKRACVNGFNYGWKTLTIKYNTEKMTNIL